MTTISQDVPGNSLVPTPPDPGARATCVLRTLAAMSALCAGIPGRPLAEQCAALLLAACACLAIELARESRSYAPLRTGLLVLALIDAALAALRWTFLAGGPYFGLYRVAFHLQEALVLATFATIPLVAASPSVDGRRWRLLRGTVVLGAVVALAWLVLGYPTVRSLPVVDRGAWLCACYLAVDVAALLAACLALWWGRRSSPTPDARTVRQVVACLVVGDAVLLAVGAWRRGLFGAPYAAHQAGLCALYLVVAAVQARALVGGRRVAP